MNKLERERLERLQSVHNHAIAKSNGEVPSSVLELARQPGWMSLNDWYFVQLMQGKLRITELEQENARLRAGETSAV